MTDDYFADNLASWDERAPAHASSEGYAVRRFLEDPGYLSDVVSFDRPRLGDIAGLRGVHLQCHIGTDTVSLARLGARMTGLDFSPAAISEARLLARSCGADVDFVESTVADALTCLPRHAFDLVYTGIGALCWLPSIEEWADVVVGLLAPGGRLFVREGHPMLWSLDETRTDDLVVRYPYVEHPEPVTDISDASYVDVDVSFTATRSHSWNHGLGETVSALLRRGLTITMLEEHDSVPWEALPGQMSCDERGEWRLTERPERLPLTYTLQAVAAA